MRAGETTGEDAGPAGSMPEAVREAVVERLRLIASPKRIALLEALRDGEASVQELADRLDLRHQKASHHLVLLRQAGIVSRRTEGATSFYSIFDWTLLWVVDQLARAVVDDS